jgi:uncharacterized membrane protein
MDFLTFVVFVVVGIFLYTINGRVNDIERMVEANKKETPSLIAKPEEGQVPRPAVASMAETLPQPAVERSVSEPSVNFGDWIKEDWIVKLGALLLLIGFGWLATYAFMNNWIGPMGRIILGIMAGVVFLIVGAFRIQKHQNQGEVFSVLGSTVILVTTFAARMYYGFFDPLMALALMFMSVVFVAFIGVRYKSKYLPLISLILAGIAPLLTHAATVNYVSLFTYLVLVVLGVIWVVAITGQRSLVSASLLLVFFYSLPHFFGGNSELLLFAYLFTIIFFVSNIISIIKSETKEMSFNMLTAGMNGLFLLCWVLSTEQEEFKSLIIAAWMLVFAIGAFLVFQKTGKKEPFYVYALASISMLAAATALELSGNTLLIAYSIESMIISISIYFIMKEVAPAEGFAALLIGPVVLSIGTIYSYAIQPEPLTKEFFSLIIVTAAVMGTGLFFWDKAKAANNKECTQINDFLVILGSGYIYLLIWMFFGKLIEATDMAATVSLIIYTIIGLSVYFYGVWEEKKGFRIYGQALLALIVLRLLIVDISNMEIAGKIITFFLIGALLISTAFIEKRKPRINN